MDKRSNRCYSLSLCFQREFHHYIIQQTSTGSVQVASTNKSAKINKFGSIVHVCSSVDIIMLTDTVLPLSFRFIFERSFHPVNRLLLSVSSRSSLFTSICMRKAWR
jgi:hypothetical protein